MDKIRKILPPPEVNFVVYHGNCSDGFASLLVAYNQNKNIQQYKGIFKKEQQDTELLDIIEQKKSRGESVNMLIADFSYSREFMQKLNSVCNKMVILDHHITAQEALKNLDFCYFDQNKSGCTITWEYFNYDKELPLLLKMIEDRDLWKWRTLNSREFTTAFYSTIPFDLDRYNEFIEHPGLIDEYIKSGKILMKYIQAQNEMLLKSTKFITTRSAFKIGIINLGGNGSDYGEFISTSYADFSIYWSYDHFASIIRVSIRSDKEKTNDCSKLAKMFNGGGHVNASGFVWDKSIGELIERILQV